MTSALPQLTQQPRQLQDLVPTALALLLLAPGWCGAAQDGEVKHTAVKCGKDTVVVHEHTDSPDGRYALAWTIRPTNKDVKPVDWSKFGVEGSEFAYKYLPNGDTDAGYEIVDGLLDRRASAFNDTLFEPGRYPSWTVWAQWLDANHLLADVHHKNLGALSIAVVTILPQAVAAVKVTEAAYDAVEKLAAKKRPLTDGLIFFLDKARLEHEGKTLVVEFNACKPRGSYEDFDGVLTIPLPDGKPLQAESATPADTPFTGALGEADKALNAVYARLRQHLPADQFEKLKTKQHEWIMERNQISSESAGEEVPWDGENEKDSLSAYRKARNAKALDLTTQRIAVLQQQLDSITKK